MLSVARCVVGQSLGRTSASQLLRAASSSTRKSDEKGLPERAEIVIVGGGAVGCGVAYSLAKAGKKDVVLIEKNEALCMATSAQAAGLVGQVRTSIDRMRLAMWSVKTFAELQKEGQAANTQVPSWRQVGSLRIAHTDTRRDVFRHMKETADKAGLEVEVLDSRAAERMWPGMRFADGERPAKAILWCPTDGYLQPADLTMTYAERARRDGARFVTDCALTGVNVEGGRVKSVSTTRGKIECDLLINSAGAHAYHVAAMAGVQLPIFPVRHQYLVTLPLPSKDGAWPVHPGLPVLRAEDMLIYARPDVNSVLYGGFETKSRSLDPRSYALSAEPPVNTEEELWPVLADFSADMGILYPASAHVGVRRVFSGWPTFTPDGRFCVGPTKQLKGFVMAGGCNAHGVSGSAGLGHHVVEALLEKSPSKYVQSLSPDRFGDVAPGAPSWDGARKAAAKIYETYYAKQGSG